MSSDLINDKIAATKVRLISEDGEQLGVVKIDDAIIKAEEAGLDLVEVAQILLLQFAKYLITEKLNMRPRKSFNIVKRNSTS